MAEFGTVRGMQDILPASWPMWEWVMAEAERVARLFGYRRIETPTLAQTELFIRTTGEGTDIVEKEMYSFQDKGGEHLTLRPEGTAPVVRAYLQHGMQKWPQPVKLYYFEHMFRRENPQRGRYREHHQFGCEAIGVEDAYVDVEMISLLVDLYRRLSLHDLTLLINSIGDRSCRPAYVKILVDYLRGHQDQLAPRDVERLQRNPLRVLDTKERDSLPVVESAPSILEYLCPDCRSHWDRLRHGLDVLGIAYRVEPHLVRGLDYYTRTVFEFQSAEEGAASTVNGGGRYDALSELLGGPPTPGIGFGLGLERLILLLQSRGITRPESAAACAFVAHIGDSTEDAALRQSWVLRREDVPTVMSFGQRSLKAQLKSANSAGARVAVIVGEDELTQGSVTVRNLEDHSQVALPLYELPARLRESEPQ